MKPLKITTLHGHVSYLNPITILSVYLTNRIEAANCTTIDITTGETYYLKGTTIEEFIKNWEEALKH
jgi:uncharacterized protein YlzI (FlbEa/FlbD family)